MIQNICFFMCIILYRHILSFLRLFHISFCNSSSSFFFPFLSSLFFFCAVKHILLERLSLLNSFFSDVITQHYSRFPYQKLNVFKWHAPQVPSPFINVKQNYDKTPAGIKASEATFFWGNEKLINSTAAAPVASKCEYKTGRNSRQMKQ